MRFSRLRSLRDVLRGAGILFVGTMTTQVLTGLLYLLAARAMLPAGYGSAAAVASMSVLAVAVCDFGGATFALREHSAGRSSDQDLLEWQRSKAAIVLAASPVAGGIAALAGGSFDISTVAAAAALFVGGSAALLLGIALRARLHFGALVTATVLSRLPGVGVLGLLVWRGEVGGNILVLLLALNSGLEALLYWVFERRLTAVAAAQRPLRWINPYRSSIGVGSSATVNSLGTLDITLVRGVAGASVAGEYAAVNRWMGPIGLASQAVTQAVFPRLSSAAAGNRQAGLTNALMLISLSLPVVGCVALAAPWLVRTFLGTEYAGSAGALRLLCLAIVFAMACQPLSAALVAWKLEKHAAGCVLLGVVVQFAAQALGSVRIGADGAAAGFAVGQAFTMALLLVCLRRTRRLWNAEDDGSAGDAHNLVIDDDRPVSVGDGRLRTEERDQIWR